MEPARPADAAPETAAATPAAAAAGVPAGGISPAGVPAGGVPAGQAGRGRAERPPRDMVISLAVLLVPIALVLIFYRVVLDGDAPRSIDPGPTIQQAQAASVFPVAEPRGLGDDWHVASATWRREATGATLRLGYVAPGDAPVQLIESSVPAETLLPRELGRTLAPHGFYQNAGRAWQRYAAGAETQALVLLEKNRSVIVLGQADVRQLEKLAASLS
ncbi:uncharacterized protein DUF4245 [Krasilnikovia cinnamomea]|uniref:Uncharacterized protein DUF4245 n=1 Tax=Krasilnikovia cinnamomea TaxID=349313 RepID=A0A4Q7ZHF5_9ACTN|nr:DUF4245 domain-containing protein [Krasilnikovia cinnamomea]RZU50227.1 uncharacterized protein DUF4245 [Krasilnikovia cinnamomea]